MLGIGFSVGGAPAHPAINSRRTGNTACFRMLLMYLLRGDYIGKRIRSGIPTRGEVQNGTTRVLSTNFDGFVQL